jgi:putative protease
MNLASPSGCPHRRLPELLAPAGSHEKLVTAVRYGADAVYLGGRDFSLRARAANFDAAGLRRAVDHAHVHGVKVYVTVNIFAHNRDFEALAPYLEELRDIGADGLIVADPGISPWPRRWCRSCRSTSPPRPTSPMRPAPASGPLRECAA